MKKFSDNLELEMQRSIENCPFDADSVKHAEEALKIVLHSFNQLKAWVKMKTFSSKEEEIEFFKEIKPTFSSKLIYYNEIYRMETAKPVGNTKRIVKFYNAEEKRLTEFYYSHLDFYKYYRSQSNNMDKKYFIRRKQDIKTGIDSHFFQSDFDFNTTHDFLVARILANDLLQKYLIEKKRNANQKEQSTEKIQKGDSNQMLNWTGSKVALVEIIYALHFSGVINNGNTSLNKLVLTLESVFNIKLSQYNRVFLEIKNRKSIDQTAFLNQLKKELTKRMHESEK
jgi:hypothetical protein